MTTSEILGHVLETITRAAHVHRQKHTNVALHDEFYWSYMFHMRLLDRMKLRRDSKPLTTPQQMQLRCGSTKLLYQ